MQAHSELALMIKTVPVASTAVRTNIERGSSPWIFVGASVSFAVVLAIVTYLSTISF
jgi:hypothetical protein